MTTIGARITVVALMRVAFVVCSLSLAAFGCASNHTAKKPAPKKADEPAQAAAPTNTRAEEEALVRMKEKQFPPVEVGPWLCQPREWNDKGQVRLHCSAPTGTKDVAEALKADPAVADVEPPK